MPSLSRGGPGGAGSLPTVEVVPGAHALRSLPPMGVRGPALQPWPVQVGHLS